MELQVKLEVFDGPLDLLLHLIEKNKVDIFDIPIVLITEQYLDYVRKMDTKDMDVMSEFLVMAATLVKIKSKMLLPAEEEEQEEEEDPRQELVERLLEYKMYKYASFELKDRQVDAGKVFFKEPSIPDEMKKLPASTCLSFNSKDAYLYILYSKSRSTSSCLGSSSSSCSSSSAGKSILDLIFTSVAAITRNSLMTSISFWCPFF